MLVAYCTIFFTDYFCPILCNIYAQMGRRYLVQRLLKIKGLVDGTVLFGFFFQLPAQKLLVDLQGACNNTSVQLSTIADF